jgi:hypothetical protein
MRHVTVENEGDGFYSIRVQLAGFNDLLSAIQQSESMDSVVELWSLEGLDLNLDIDQLRQLADKARVKRHKPHRTAIVATGDLNYGLTRVYSAFRAEESVQTAVFRCEQDARNWLETDD